MKKQFDVSAGGILGFDLTQQMNRFLEKYAEKVIYERYVAVTKTLTSRDKLLYLQKNVPEYYGISLEYIREDLRKAAEDRICHPNNLPHEALRRIDKHISLPKLIPFVTLENAMLVFSPATGVLFRWAFLAFVCQDRAYKNILDIDGVEMLTKILNASVEFKMSALDFEKTLETYFPNSIGIPREAIRPDESDAFPYSIDTLHALALEGRTIQNMQDDYFRFVVEQAVPEMRKLIKHMRFVHVERLNSVSYLDPDFFVTPSYRQEFNAGIRKGDEGGMFQCLYPQREVW